jgi:hypothetical protein
MIKNKHAVALGRKGGKAGTGKAKARTSAQATLAAAARWDKWRALTTAWERKIHAHVLTEDANEKLKALGFSGSVKVVLTKKEDAK